MLQRKTWSEYLTFRADLEKEDTQLFVQRKSDSRKSANNIEEEGM